MPSRQPQHQDNHSIKTATVSRQPYLLFIEMKKCSLIWNDFSSSDFPDYLLINCSNLRPICNNDQIRSFTRSVVKCIFSQINMRVYKQCTNSITDKTMKNSKERKINQKPSKKIIKSRSQVNTMEIYARNNKRLQENILVQKSVKTENSSSSLSPPPASAPHLLISE